MYFVLRRTVERKLNRLKGYNYSQYGWYFVTICTKNREEFFGEIKNGIMGLNDVGCVVMNYWNEIPNHFSHVKLDAFVIMPNHLHGIVVIDNTSSIVGDADLRPLRVGNNRTKMLLSKIIHGFKSSVTRTINNVDLYTELKWQRSFYDHIIRNEKSLNNIRKYIQNNPINWIGDRNFLHT